jgi:hypothetical protein
MKRFTGIAATFLLLAVPMFGANSKPKTVVIPDGVQIGTTRIPEGSYKLAWTAGAGQEVQATLTQNGKTVITFAAKAVTAKNNAPGVGTDGAQLTQIMLENLDLQVESTPQATAAGGGSL